MGTGVGEKGVMSASISVTWPVPSCVYVPVARLNVIFYNNHVALIFLGMA